MNPSALYLELSDLDLLVGSLRDIIAPGNNSVKSNNSLPHRLRLGMSNTRSDNICTPCVRIPVLAYSFWPLTYQPRRIQNSTGSDGQFMIHNIAFRFDTVVFSMSVDNNNKI